MPTFHRSVSTSMRRSYFAGAFDLTIDDRLVKGAYVKSIEGGHVKMNTADEKGGSAPGAIKHITTLEVEPITAEIGMSQANKLLHWVAKSWRKEFCRHSGAITHGDTDHKAQFIHEFRNALIEEVAFPSLDATSKDTLWLKIKLRPEEVFTKFGDGHPLQANNAAKQKLCLCSAFRLKIDGVDTEFVNKIDGFTVKQAVKPVACGPMRLPELEPCSVTFPNLKITMTLGHARSMHAWYEKLKKGVRDPAGERNGAIEFLTPDRKQVIFTIKLLDVMVTSFNIPKSEANQDQVKRCTFDLSVGWMDLDGDIRLALEQ